MTIVADVDELGPADAEPLAGVVAARAEDAPTVAPGSPIRATTVPIGTVVPAGTRISSSTPSYGLGISESTLSVDTSNSGSSKAMGSPTFLSQVVSSPSVTVSPSLGIVTNHSSDIRTSPGLFGCGCGDGKAGSPERRQPCSERPEKVIMVSPIASDRLG